MNISTEVILLKIKKILELNEKINQETDFDESKPLTDYLKKSNKISIIPNSSFEKKLNGLLFK